MTASHRFGTHWSLSLNYSHAKDNWSAKDGMIFDPDLNGQMEMLTLLSINYVQRIHIQGC